MPLYEEGDPLDDLGIHSARDDSIERIKAKLLVHTLKASEGGYKLSMEMIAILGVAFEDSILPGDPQVMAEALRQVLRNWNA